MNTTADQHQDFVNSVKEFMADDSYLNDYSWFNLMKDDQVLVRVFRYQPKKKISSIIGGETQEILVRDFQGNYVPASQAYHAITVPIIKIIKSSDSSGTYASGDVCSVISGEITGKTQNPDYLYALQFSRMQGAEPILPDDLRKEIPAIEKNWLKYMVVHPYHAGPTSTDKLTYCIPTIKIQSKLSVDELD